MGPAGTALLCLGLCMGQGIKAQAETFLRPTLEADSSPVIPQGTPVTLRCKGHPGAIWYFLMKGEIQFQGVLGEKMEANFHIHSMTRDTAGSYHCFYMTLSGFSEPSEPLELVMTGLYSKPSLSAAPSQEVALGQNVTLRCQDEQNFDRFVFYKEGGASTCQLQNKTSQPDFLIPVVTAAHGGLYRCYVFHSQYPYLWSESSDPLEINITVPETSGPRPKPPDMLLGLPRLHAGILMGISALLILLFLFFLLFLLLRNHQQQQQARLWTGGEDAGVEKTLRSCSRAEDAPLESPYVTVEDVQAEERRNPSALVEDPQEVTYAHLIHKTPSQHLEQLPPFPPGETTLYAPLAIQ
ncbi:platelet glycoprotein VI-like isoform X4 [Phascolarctos cinereus]|uniref:Platelet glycoprotein VI-like isoform X3 n=1 Tax=Phascolarctos cinereus TaxID=38626 RepID=A0A6P5LUQ6_PHACI|nr:platelet glycoprotein VI-like isoform X3 [Phascolarctos cinereus]